jgi:hypothetical protein
MGFIAETRLFGDALWDDGNAEIARYRATMPFYGAMREGEAVLIVVKEPFDMDALVKADGDVAHEHVEDVIKLNEVRTFQTGVYTYRQMASAFFSRPELHPLKLVTSSQEWCGITTKILTVRGGEALLRSFSYFGDEGERAETIALGDDVVFADALPVFVRTLDFGREGLVRRIRLVDEQLSNRAKPPAVVHETIEVLCGGRAEVPAGRFETCRVMVTRGAEIDTFHLDRAPPHTLVRWDRADGGTYELTLVARAPYWSMHDPEHVGELLPAPATPPTPPAPE